MAGSSRAQRLGTGWLPTCCLVVTTLFASRVTAAPEAPVQTVVVMVPEAVPPLPLRRLIDALRSQLAELGIGVQVSTGPAAPGGTGRPLPVGPDRDVLAFVWIEHTGEVIVVHFYEPAGTSLRERHIPVSGTDAASIEEVAVVVRSAANALLERAQERAPEPAPPRAPVKKPAAVVATTEPSRSTAPLQASLAYAGTLYATDTAWQHGAIASLSYRVGVTPWRLGVGYAWFPPLRHAADDLEISLSRHPIELSFGFEVPALGPRVSLRAEGAGIADYVVRRTSRVSPELGRTPGEARWSWALSTRLRLGWETAPGMWLLASGGAEFLLNRFEYVAQGPDEQAVLSPLLVRPSVAVGAALDLP